MRGATTDRSKDIVTFWYKKCIFGYLTGQKGGISPHTGKPEKSCLLRFLINSEYDASQKVWKKSYGSFSRTRPHFGFWLLRVKAWLGGRSGPLPAPKSPKIPQKEAATKDILNIDTRLINNTLRVVALPPLRHASFRLSATTRGVLFISLAANSLHELLAMGHLVTGTEWRFQFWPFCFERVRRSHCPADEWERRHSEWLPFKHSRCCVGGPATSFEPPVKIKNFQKKKIWNFWEPFSMVVKFWNLSA